MDAHYQTMYKQAAALQHKFHDYTHTVANDPMANILRRELHGLTNDIASNKHPSSIDARLRGIQSQIRNNQANHLNVNGFSNPVLNSAQGNHLYNNFERMRQTFRQHPNF